MEKLHTRHFSFSKPAGKRKEFGRWSMYKRILVFGGLSLGAFFQISSSGFAQTISTYAGPPLPVNGAQAISQTIDWPKSVVPDGAGGFYIASVTQHRVYRVAADGSLRLIAGSHAGYGGDGGPATAAQLNNPTSVAVDAAGNLYIADTGNYRVRKVSASGVISTVAGDGTLGYGGDGGPATSAQISAGGVAVDTTGNLYIADSINFSLPPNDSLPNNRIRKVTAGGVISTVAGNGTSGFSGDGGPATSAQFAYPGGIAVDTEGNLYIADTGNSRIRKVSGGGVISTVAGNGAFGFSGDGGPATSAELDQPGGVAVDAMGNLYIADTVNYRVRRVSVSGVISTVAGNGRGGYSGDGGPANSAELDKPGNVAVDATGNLYIADYNNGRIRKVNAGAIISTVAGKGTAAGYSGDGGPATSAQLNEPRNVAVDATGNLYIADTGNDRIRKVTAGGTISTVARLNFPQRIAIDAAGNLYVADTNNHLIRKVTADGVISTVAGNGTFGFSGDGGPATSAQLDNPQGVAMDTVGNLYIADTRNSRIRKVTADGVISTVAGNGTYGFSGDGGPATSAQLASPDGVAVDAAGNLYIADGLNGRIRKVTADGVISTVAGNGTYGFSGDGGPATSAQLRNPTSLSVDAAGNLYIADTGNYRVRKVSASGVISTVAGDGALGYGGDGGPATFAQLNFPQGIAIDAAANVYIADTRNSRIRKVTFMQQTTYSIVERGGMSLRSSGTLPATVVGYASIQANSDTTPPAGLAIFGFRQNNILVSEAGVPASPSIRSGRIYAEVNGPVNTGLAMANPNNQPATISFYFTNSNGDFGNGTTTIPANAQIATFLNQAPFNGPSPLSGTFTFNSSAPVAVIALRGLVNERGEFLITTLPVADLTTAATAPIVFPHFADGGGWTTQIVLVNPGDSVLTGTVQLFDQQGASNTSFAYSIPVRSSQKLQTAGAASSVVSGSVRVIPASSTAAPSGLAIFSFRNGGITVAEAGVPAIAPGNAFRLYAEVSGPIQTGIAVLNTSSNAANVTLEASRLDGSSTGLTGTLSIPANGQTAVFLSQVQGLGSLQTPFQGVLRLSSSALISVTGLRGRYNERDDFLITTTPAINEATAPSASALYFPHIADSGGYTTQFILFSAQPGPPSSGAIQFFSQAGGALNITLQ
jgi:sugar lactone lactonase YvrE